MIIAEGEHQTAQDLQNPEVMSEKDNSHELKR
jgi:hypothetical protein